MPYRVTYLLIIPQNDNGAPLSYSHVPENNTKLVCFKHNNTITHQAGTLKKQLTIKHPV
jgi:hypothetical protein